jgi:hypothetical protein
VQYLPWSDGAAVRSFGASVLPQILGLLRLPEKPMIVTDPGEKGMEISASCRFERTISADSRG